MIKSAAAATAVLAAAGLAACSSGSSEPATTSGTEQFTSGVVTNPKVLEAKATVFTLKWTGPVTATGSINLSGPAPSKGQTHTFVTSKGNLVVLVTANPVNTAKWVNAKTCLAQDVTAVQYSVDGTKSTGSFMGATGSGVVRVTFQSNSELDGKCSLASSAQPVTMKDAFGEFAGSGPLTVKG
jgi:hypothetical protein